VGVLEFYHLHPQRNIFLILEINIFEIQKAKAIRNKKGKLIKLCGGMLDTQYAKEITDGENEA
jgi:hypothetical protein